MIKCDKIKSVFCLVSCFLFSSCYSNVEIGKAELNYSLVEVVARYFDDFEMNENDLKSYLEDYLISEEKVVKIINRLNECIELTFYFSFTNKSKYIPGKDFNSYIIEEMEIILNRELEYYVEKDKTVAINPPLYPGEKTKYYPRAKVLLIIPNDDKVKIHVLREIIASAKYSFKCLYKVTKNNKLEYPDKTSILESDTIKRRIFRIEGSVGDLEKVSKYVLSF